jgi:hypothetical protein
MCSADYTLISGGCEITGPVAVAEDQDILINKPLASKDGWFCDASDADRDMTAYAYCCKGAVIGSGTAGAATSIEVASADHPNSYKGCVAVSSPPNVPAAAVGWGDVDYANKVWKSPLNLIVDGENICSDEDGCTYYIWKIQENGNAGFTPTFPYMITLDGTGHGMTRRVFAGTYTDGTFTNGDGVMEYLFADLYCHLLDDLPGYEVTKDKLVLVDASGPVDPGNGRCTVRICD